MRGANAKDGGPDAAMLKRLADLRLTVESVWPMLRRTLLTGQLWNPQCVLTEPDPDVLCEYDGRIPMQEGFRNSARLRRRGC